jgi:hypothetical protein
VKERSFDTHKIKTGFPQRHATITNLKKNAQFGSIALFSRLSKQATDGQVRWRRSGARLIDVSAKRSRSCR